MPPTPSIAVIIPVKNDDRALARLLSALNEVPAGQFAETIVVSADENESTRTLVRDNGATFLLSESGRGLQMNTGAEAAVSDILWFLHADAHPLAGSATAIRQHIGKGMIGGYFRFSFADTTSRGARRLAALINWRAERGVAYGDQGLFFTRDFFSEQRGFDASPLFEEVALVRKAHASGRFAGVATSIGVDPRRWEQTGWIRRTILNRALALGHAAGISPERLARWYRRF